MSASSFAVGLLQLSQMLARPAEERAVEQKLFEWISVGSFQVDAGLLLDQLSICFVLLITGVGTLIHIIQSLTCLTTRIAAASLLI
jgi:NADH-quinone oxidoreductase subunit L